MPDISLLLYGGSGTGKTTQLGVLAERVYKRKGKKTRIYSADKGGYRTIEPYVRLGLIDIHTPQGGATWQWVRYTTQGYTFREGKWVAPTPEELAEVGAWCFEGFTSYCDLMMQDLALKAEQGINIGGAPSVVVQDGTLKVGGNNQAHYGLAQGAVLRAHAQSTQLPGDYLVWTALTRRAQEEESSTPLLGPQLAGKALTDNAPAWFTYTFHLLRLPAEGTRKEDEHRMYMKAHKDLTVPGALAVGNDRRCLDTRAYPEYIAPASLDKALDVVEVGLDEATETIAKRLGLSPAGLAGKGKP